MPVMAALKMFIKKESLAKGESVRKVLGTLWWGKPLALPWASAQSPQGGVAEHTKPPSFICLNQLPDVFHILFTFHSQIRLCWAGIRWCENEGSFKFKSSLTDDRCLSMLSKYKIGPKVV